MTDFLLDTEHAIAEDQPSIDWDAVQYEYGERAALRALDVVMSRNRERGIPLDWDATKAAALEILRDDYMPGSSHAARLRDQGCEVLRPPNRGNRGEQPV